MPNSAIKYVLPNDIGIQRQRTGRAEFAYINSYGEVLTDNHTLKRIERLAIPPNWNDVWISPDGCAHIQAIGFDDKGRKQYVYHQEWVETRQQAKFDKLALFGNKLPHIRKRIQKDLKLRHWPKNRVLALAISLLDGHYLRIGNDYYTSRNETYGLTTLRRKHLDFDDDALIISYKAKSGKYRKVKVQNATLRNLILATSELPGYEVFRYIDERGKSQTIDSKDVNEYLYKITGEEITAKDFRTWGGTVLAIKYFDDAKKACLENSRTKLETQIVKRVAKKLGNTVSTCRQYYIHPKVLSILVEEKLDHYKSFKKKKIELTDSEHLLLNILR